MMKVMMGLYGGGQVGKERLNTQSMKKETYEYHSQAEYSVLMRRERVLRPL